MARITVAPAFVLGLTLLFINDYFLKQSFPGVISGKLSDLAGLFIVGILATAAGNGKPRNLIILCLLFLWWKSPLAGPAIAAWNSLGIYQAGRTIDYTDNLALVMLPLAYRYTRSRPLTVCRRPFVYIVAPFAALGIMGTSPARYDIYRDIIEQPEAPATSEVTTATGSTEEFMGALQEIAQARGLVLADSVEGSEYRNYSSAEIVLNAHYDRSRKKGYLRIYAKDPYRRSLREQKNVVNTFWPILEQELTERGFTIVPHNTSTEYGSPITRIRLTMTSPTKGIPLTSGYNGTGNEEIAQAQRVIDDFFISKGFTRALRDFCYPTTSGFSRDTCRNYHSGRPLGADRESRTTDVKVQGDVVWQGTVLAAVKFDSKIPNHSILSKARKKWGVDTTAFISPLMENTRSSR